MTLTQRRTPACLPLAVLCGCLPAPAAAQVSLAAAREGAQLVAASSSQSGDFASANLIDGSPDTSWATAEGKVEKQWVIVRLAGARVVEIGSLAIDNTTTRGHPAEAGVRGFELDASTAGRGDGDFERVGLFSCRMGGGRQVFTFPPARARYIRLLLKANYGHATFIEVNELEVYAVGSSPVHRPTGPVVLLHAAAPDAMAGPRGPLAKSLTALGARVMALPGSRGPAHLAASDLLGVDVVATCGDPGLTKDETQLLSAFCRRGGGLVAALSPEGSTLTPLLKALGASIVAGPAGPPGTAELLPHWITDGLTGPLRTAPGPLVALEGAAPLARVNGVVIALAGRIGQGRLVVLPLDLLTDGKVEGEGSSGDSLALARRAVLWAARKEEVPQPPPTPLPAKLAGQALFLVGGKVGEMGLSFTRLETALRERGLQVTEASTPPGQFQRTDLGDASLLIAFMPTPSPAAGRGLAEWVAAGGAMLVLGDPASPAAEITRVNEFLREFGVAIASAPAKNLTVGLAQHPATEGIEALSRLGDILGVWSFQGTMLAEMAGTPVAAAYTFGRGRLVVMDAGFALDPVEPPSGQKKPPPASGIQLAQNEQFVIQCVAWLLARP